MDNNNKVDSSKFGERLHQIRIQHGWSQEELAEKLNTSKQVISRYERGERIPKILAAARYAVVLGVSLSELTGTEQQYTAEEVQSMVLNAPPASEQKILIDKLNKLTPENRVRFDAYLDGLLAAQEKSEA